MVDGKIAAVLSDNGSEFAKYFDEACRKFNITHIFSRVRTPKDNVVDERFNRTIQEEFMETDEYFEPYLARDSLIEANQRLTEWLMFYNFERPHQTLKYKTPIEWCNNNYKLKEMSPMYPSITIEITNIGDKPVPVNLGVHYYWATPESWQGTQINKKRYQRINFSEQKPLNIEQIGFSNAVLWTGFKEEDNKKTFDQKYCCIEPVIGTGNYFGSDKSMLFPGYSIKAELSVQA